MVLCTSWLTMTPQLSPSPARSPRSATARVAVAVVDDHTFMRDLIARALRRASTGYDVVATVGTAAEAIAVCRRFEPQLLVLDINLPDRTGVAAVPDIKRASP